MNWSYTVAFLVAPLIAGGVAWLVSKIRKTFFKRKDSIDEELSVYKGNL